MPNEIETLTKLKPELSKEFGVDELGVFGSFADNSFDEKSDIDIFSRVLKKNWLEIL
jgi:predicted nucleotidyltransferase